MQCLRRATGLRPDFFQALFVLGNLLWDAGDLAEASECYREAIALEPGFAEAHFNLGNAARALGDSREAEASYRRALQVRPNFAQAWNNLGQLFKDRNRIEEALECYGRAIEINPGLAEAHYNIGVARQLDGRFYEGLAHFEQALRHDPSYAPARWLHDLSLPILYERPEEIRELRQRFSTHLRRLIRETPLDSPDDRRRALSGVASTTHFFLQYQGQNDRDLQREYGEFLQRVMATGYPQWSSRPPMPALGAGRADPRRVRLLVHAGPHGRAVPARLAGGPPARSLRDLLLPHRQRYRRGDGPDPGPRGRVPPGGRAPRGRRRPDRGRPPAPPRLHRHRHECARLAAGRPAAGTRAVQGLGASGHDRAAVDRLLPQQRPHGARRRGGALLRKPWCGCRTSRCITRPLPFPRGRSRARTWACAHDAFVYLNSQSLFKNLPQHDDIYPRIAREVPHAQFVFISHSRPAVTARFRDRLARAFDAHGLPADRFCHFTRRLDFQGFLSLNLASDALLDTLEWSGGKTTLEALSCGLPVVTCPGRFMRGRHAFAMLRMMGITRTVAADKDDYVRIAVELAHDPGLLARDALPSGGAQKPPASRQPLHRGAGGLLRQRGCRQIHRDAAGAAMSATAPVQRPPTPPDNAAAWLRQADAHHTAGRLDDALACYSEALRLHPGLYEACYNAGLIYQSRRQPCQASAFYRKALQVKPDLPPAWNNLGRIHLDAGELEPAADCFLQAIRLKPDFAEAHFNLGEVLRTRQKPREAIEAYRMALRLNPTLVGAWNNLGNLLRDGGDLVGAAECFREVVRLRPDIHEGHYNLGSTLKDIGRAPEAVACLCEAIRLQPDHAESLE